MTTAGPMNDLVSLFQLSMLISLLLTLPLSHQSTSNETNATTVEKRTEMENSIQVAPKVSPHHFADLSERDSI